MTQSNGLQSVAPTRFNKDAALFNACEDKEGLHHFSFSRSGVPNRPGWNNHDFRISAGQPNGQIDAATKSGARPPVGAHSGTKNDDIVPDAY